MRIVCLFSVLGVIADTALLVYLLDNNSGTAIIRREIQFPYSKFPHCWNSGAFYRYRITTGKALDYDSSIFTFSNQTFGDESQLWK